MDELTEAEIASLKQVLLRLRGELQEILQATLEGSKPVDLDEPIGRLTRMDAMQQQSMTAANRRSGNIRLRQVQQALAAIERGVYGECKKCEDPIGYPRLAARPESPYCLDCQDEVDRKHGS